MADPFPGLVTQWVPLPDSPGSWAIYPLHGQVIGFLKDLGPASNTLYRSAVLS